MKTIKILLTILVLTISIFADKAQVDGFVERFYVTVLDRASEKDGLDYWSYGLLSGREAGADIARGFIFSEEFINRDTNTEEFLNVLYRAFFNREADIGGFNSWKSLLEQGYSRNSILDGFLFSQEFSNLCNEYKISPVKKAYKILVKKTGQTESYDENGNVDTSIKDDGYYQSGMTPSYTENDNETIRDNVTGIVWQNDSRVRDDNYKEMPYNAFSYCSTLDFAGSSNWRLALLLDYFDIATLNQDFKDGSSIGLFSTDKYYLTLSSLLDVSIPRYAFSYMFNLYNNELKVSYFMTNEAYNIRCINGGNENIVHELVWNENKDIMTDNTTYLEWQDNEEADRINLKWKEAIDYCENLVLGDRDDWRLPNFNEVYNDPFTPFKNISYSLYWTSTSLPKDDYKSAKVLNCYYRTDSILSAKKSENHLVRCVRGGA